jgi:hypothetical protein
LQSFSELTDPRKEQGKQYDMEEILMGCMSLYFLKVGSRNQLNNNRRCGYFSENYKQLFGMQLPHQDTVSDVVVKLDEEELERVVSDAISGLFEQKLLRPYRLLDKYYTIAVDATGVVSYDKRHCEHCLTKTSKKGKTTYYHYVLEAKLVTIDGHAISMAREWIENPSGDFDKQDCERKAFERLAKKLKKIFPRLPICILADGLYPYENAFKICEENGWKFIFVLQNDSLKSVQEELTLPRRKNPITEVYNASKSWRIKKEYRFETNIEYHAKYSLNWIQVIETKNKIIKSSSTKPTTEVSNFEYVTNFEVDRNNIREIADKGRLRWKIENEGFNTQKNGGYGLGHKICRKSYTGLKNYYILLQIAHVINQLIEKGKIVTNIFKMRPKESLHNIWNNIISYMTFFRPVITCVKLE